MRAVLILVVLVLWLSCIGGAIGLTAYLVTVGARALLQLHEGGGGSPSPPGPGVVKALVLFAVIMAAAAGVLAGVVMWGRTSGPASSALAWVSLPLWAAVSATITAVVLSRRTRLPAHEPHSA